MYFVLSLLLNALALIITSKIVDGFHVEGFGTAILVAIVLGVVNTIIKPILLILTAPINILTLGLFTFVINAFVLVIVAAIIPGQGFSISSFWPTGILAALVLSVVSTALSMLAKDVTKKK